MVSIDPIFLDFIIPPASGWCPPNKGTKNMANGTYKLIVKDGDTKYRYNKTGDYKPKTVDHVEEFDDFAAALYGLLEWTTDEYNEFKVSLSFTPKKKK